MQEDAEITLEMDPGTFTYDRLLTLRELGVNRISMGVQSFDDAILKHCGRPHTVEDTYRALEDLHRAQWENFSIDLISSLPHLTSELWQNTLQKAVSAGSAHISVYDLQIEPKTAFGRWYTPNKAPLPSEPISAEMYGTAVRTLTGAGFEHYEVSNYAQPGRRSRHNLKYWSLAPVYAFGMSAASYVHRERFSRPKNMKEYEQYVQDLAIASAIQELLPSDSATPAVETLVPTGSFGAKINDNRNVSADASTDSAADTVDVSPDILDVVMLSLRTADGLHLPHFADAYGIAAAEKVVKALAPFVTRGLVEYKTSAGLAVDYGQQRNNADTAGRNSRDRTAFTGAVAGVEGSEDNAVQSVRLTDPGGFLLSNDVISSAFAALDRNACK